MGFYPPHRVTLELGKIYNNIEYYKFVKKGNFKFIKSTIKGYNFVDLDKNKLLILGRHMYPDKIEGDKIKFTFAHSFIHNVS